MKTAPAVEALRARRRVPLAEAVTGRAAAAEGGSRRVRSLESPKGAPPAMTEKDERGRADAARNDGRSRIADALGAEEDKRLAPAGPATTESRAMTAPDARASIAAMAPSFL